MLSTPESGINANAASIAVTLPLLILGGFAVVWAARWSSIRKLREMAAIRKREGNSGRALVLSHLADLGLSSEEAQRVYQYFQDWLPKGIEGFPVELDDELGRVVGICGPDVDDAAQDVAGLCHLKVPSGVDLTHEQTVRDLLDAVLTARREARPWWLGEGE
jgi:hypothetical protein